jgi:hypothetical protein
MMMLMVTMINWVRDVVMMRTSQWGKIEPERREDGVEQRKTTDNRL